MPPALNKINRPVLLIGGARHERESERLMLKLKCALFNATGNYGLLESAALMKQADTVIAHDTGFMHIAAAFGQRIVAVSGEIPFRNLE
ncbi:MAG: glycosyltransferase family 9 protein [Bacteroidia bacterium]